MCKDPRTISDLTDDERVELFSEIRDSVDSTIKKNGGLSGMSVEQQKAIAHEQTRQVLEKFRITDTQCSEQINARTDKYIDLGASPKTAAYAAASSVSARATPKADSFTINGYAYKRVGLKSTYKFNLTETLKVADSVLHGHFKTTTYEMKGQEFKVDCGTIKTTAREGERIHANKAVAKYLGSFLSLMTSSVGVFWRTTKWGGFSYAVTGMAMTFAGLRTQLSGLDADVIGGVSKNKAKNLADATLISLTVVNGKLEATAKQRKTT